MLLRQNINSAKKVRDTSAIFVAFPALVLLPHGAPN
jgi:hypothetical protein